jgi:hypothetical protein
MHKIVLISGIPASGKSCYGQWLEIEKGFIHLDVEQNGVLAQTGLMAEWTAIFASGGSVTPFVVALRKLGKPVTIDWGFPPYWLSVVDALKAEGVEIWWFDGDRQAARESFVKRGTVQVAALDRQMAAIDGAWPEIKRVFGSHVINTVSTGGSYLKPEAIYRRMFGSAKKVTTRKRARDTGHVRKRI